MKRYYPFGLIALLAVGALLALNSLRANDDEKSSKAPPKDELSEVVDLVDRIEELEKRLAKLEVREPLIRQADSRESTDVDSSGSRPAKMATDDDDEDDIPQRTNGQTWRFRLLTDRPKARGDAASPTTPTRSDGAEDSQPEFEPQAPTGRSET